MQQPDGEQETIEKMKAIGAATTMFVHYYRQPPTATSIDELLPYLSRFIATPSRTDTWGTPFRYVTDGSDFAIISAGSDRRFSTTGIPSAEPSPPTTAAGADIVYAHGKFVQFPAGRTVVTTGD